MNSRELAVHQRRKQRPQLSVQNADNHIYTAVTERGRWRSTVNGKTVHSTTTTLFCSIFSAGESESDVDGRQITGTSRYTYSLWPAVSGSRVWNISSSSIISIITISLHAFMLLDGHRAGKISPTASAKESSTNLALSLYLAPMFGMLYLTTLEIPLFPLMSSKAI